MAGVIHWLNENSGAVLAIVTTVYAVFTLLLWMATKRQTDITRKIFEATHRPAVSIRPYLRFPATPGDSRLDFELTNHGSTAAIVTGWIASVRQGEETLGEAAPFGGSLCIFPGAKEHGPPVELQGQNAAAVWGTVPQPHVEVRVTYHGPEPTVSYSTRLRAELRITGQHTLLVDEVLHEFV